MMEISYKIDQLIELAKGNKNIAFDVDDLMRTITYAQRNQERAFGL